MTLSNLGDDRLADRQARTQLINRIQSSDAVWQAVADQIRYQEALALTWQMVFCDFSENPNDFTIDYFNQQLQANYHNYLNIQ
jgi:hypothetical protein